MRVLYISQGLAVHDRRFMEAMRQQGLDVGFVRLTPQAGIHGLPTGIREFGLARGGRSLRIGAVASRRRELRRIVAEFRPDVVHAGPIQSASLLAALGGIQPLISMSWGSDILRDARRLWGNMLARFALARSSLLLCDCQAVRRRAMELGMSEERIVVFPWGVDLAQFRPKPNRREGTRTRQGRTLVLVSTRSLEPIYGPEILVDGFLEAWRAWPWLRLQLLGEGSLRSALQARCCMAGAEGAVQFKGSVEERQLVHHFARADLYVSASRSDGSSVSLLQAMACGLPPIVSDIAGNREWVADGENGWLFRDGDCHSLAHTIQRAVHQRAAWPRLASAGRRLVERDADWRRNRQMLFDAYAMAAHGG